MTDNFRQCCSCLWRAKFFSPKDFVRRAAVIILLFLAAHFAGFREYTSFLSGTMPSPDTGWKLTIFWGLLYLILYFASVLLAPILLVAAGILRCWDSSLKGRISRDSKDAK
jgi:hypothetical protein